ncbi:HRDC domain-containing protein [Methylocystis sp. MJC1]|uniref:HRDC domain-containing protein n=1 Tax=Methylocystis sp. MJC1 TaxID=2654282 RepID=UPI002B3FFDF6|nr:HRDC domain-containing protein [Methylocystis sp. MJC1]
MRSLPGRPVGLAGSGERFGASHSSRGGEPARAFLRRGNRRAVAVALGPPRGPFRTNRAPRQSAHGCADAAQRALQAERGKIAKKRRLAPRRIASDEALAALATARPRRIDDPLFQGVEEPGAFLGVIEKANAEG